MWDKSFFSAVSIALTFVAYFPYIRSIVREQTRPHVFSWVVWGCTTSVVFAAQWVGGAGVGAWPILVSAIITFSVAGYAFQCRGDVGITRSDWAYFLLAMLALPLWFLTSDPLWAVVVMTSVDLLGFAPTLRKAYVQPYSESLVFYALFAVRNLFVLLALEHYSLTTTLFSVAIALACVALVSLLLWRRAVGENVKSS